MYDLFNDAGYSSDASDDSMTSMTSMTSFTRQCGSVLELMPNFPVPTRHYVSVLELMPDIPVLPRHCASVLELMPDIPVLPRHCASVLELMPDIPVSDVPTQNCGSVLQLMPDIPVSKVPTRHCGSVLQLLPGDSMTSFTRQYGSVLELMPDIPAPCIFDAFLEAEKTDRGQGYLHRFLTQFSEKFPADSLENKNKKTDWLARMKYPGEFYRLKDDYDNKHVHESEDWTKVRTGIVDGYPLVPMYISLVSFYQIATMLVAPDDREGWAKVDAFAVEKWCKSRASTGLLSLRNLSNPADSPRRTFNFYQLINGAKMYHETHKRCVVYWLLPEKKTGPTIFNFGP
jgi:hypothetical protein